VAAGNVNFLRPWSVAVLTAVERDAHCLCYAAVVVLRDKAGLAPIVVSRLSGGDGDDSRMRPL
jgi:hypothetical protein